MSTEKISVTDQSLATAAFDGSLRYLAGVPEIHRNNYSALIPPTTANNASQGYTPGSIWIAGGIIYSLSSESLGVAVWLEAASTFGGNFEIFQDNALSGTTSQTLQQKINVVTASLPVGQYLLNTNYILSCTSANRTVGTQLNVDGVALETELQIIISTANLNYPVSNYFVFTTVAAGTHVLELLWRAISNSTTAQIKLARVMIWRVG